MGNSDNRNEFNYGGYAKENMNKKDSSSYKENSENLIDNSNNNTNSMLKSTKLKKKEIENNINISNKINLNGFNVNNNEDNLNSNNFSLVPSNKKYVKRFAYKSQPGENDNGLSKINQDNFLIMENILNNDEFKIFGVFDGHGKFYF